MPSKAATCIFCDFRAANKAALMLHSAACPKHPLWAEVERLRLAMSKEEDEIQQTLGKALGHPPHGDGVCVGDNVAASLAVGAARKIAEQAAELEQAKETVISLKEVIDSLNPYRDHICNDPLVVTWTEGIKAIGNLRKQVKGQAAELERLQLQYERDQSAYRLMQKGMESQAELMDGLKQQARSFQALAARLATALAVAIKYCHWRHGGEKDRAEADLAAAREAGITGE